MSVEDQFLPGLNPESILSNTCGSSERRVGKEVLLQVLVRFFDFLVVSVWDSMQDFHSSP